MVVDITTMGLKEVDAVTGVVQRSKDTEHKTEEQSEDAAQRAHVIKWDRVIFMALSHGLALYCSTFLPYLRWQSIVWYLVWYNFSAFGVTGGAHRLWTHRSYKAKLPLRIFLMLGHAASGMNDLFNWVRDHRVHHLHSETDADPHDARRGLFFSHVGWLMVTKHPAVVRQGRRVDMSDILGDPVCAFDRKYHIPMQVFLAFVLPTAIPVALWNEPWTHSLAFCFIRYIMSVNAIWSINSFAHAYGTHPYSKSIAPADCVWIAWYSNGEGWHNYHHVFPWDFKSGEFGRFNLSMHFIRLCEFLGLAYDLKAASPALVERVAKRFGDGSRPELLENAPEIPEEAAVDPSVVDSLKFHSKVH